MRKTVCHYHLSPITHHLSLITYHLSLITYHSSPITYHSSPITKMFMAEQTKKAIWNGQIVRRAVVDSLKKLNPRAMMKNPVMFVVEVGSVLTTLQLIRGIVAPIP